jgi:putative redox protein
MTITAHSLKNFRVEIRSDRHQIIADEPSAFGGDDTGLNPYDLLLASLAACKIITVKMYARRKKWPLDAIELTMSTHKIHAKDCEDCESNPDARVDIIETQIRFIGNLDKEQLNRLTEISELCPVHRTLTSETKIRTKRLN